MASDHDDMVGWYDPAQLARTGLQTVLSEVFSQRADFRLIEALGSDQPVFDHGARDALWFDYAADTGDAYRTTRQLAEVLTRPLTHTDGATLPVGDFVILGGDQVYPAAGRAEYERRFLRPFREGAPPVVGVDARPIYALPGNHDWYDGLSAFMDVFCQKQAIGRWQGHQSRSYFALRLPHRHWLVALDFQLQHDIDLPQRLWVESQLKGARRGDHVVVCVPEPFWVFEQTYGATDGAGLQTLALLRTLEVERGLRVVAWIAGDLHHYRRMSGGGVVTASKGVHFITAGGGGAFLHPTHVPYKPRLQGEFSFGPGAPPRRYVVESEYPDRARSRAYALHNLKFLWLNPSFGVVTGAVYLMLSWVLPRPEAKNHPTLAEIFVAQISGATERITRSPGAFAWIAVVIAAFIVFTDTRRLWYRVAAGVSHAVWHLGLALASTCVGVYVASELVGDGTRGAMGALARWAIAGATTFVGGFFFGPLVMGVYLMLSVLVWGRHGNEAFSSLKIDGYKNLLRVRVDRAGLHIYALGIDRVGDTPRVIDVVEVPTPVEEQVPS